MDERSEPRPTASWVALRAVVWSSLFAGTVAGYVPWRFFGADPARIRPAEPLTVAGLAVLAAGAGLALWCTVEFVRSGRGTPAPIDPPRELVVRGPYRLVRNPMYVGMLLILCGEALIFRSLPLLGWAVAWWGLIHLLVVGYEEPTLHGKFGEAYERYTRRVGRWMPSFARRGERD